MSMWCDRLEDRMLLSAVPAPIPTDPIGGTYSGVLRMSAMGAAPRPASITFSQSNQWPLAGSVTAAGIGTFNFVGAARGKCWRLVFAGNSLGAGELILRPVTANTLRGTFVENIGNHTIRSDLQLRAAQAPQGSNAPAIRIGKVRASESNVTGVYQGVTAASRGDSLVITGESVSGLIAGTLTLGKQTFSATGIVRGDQLDLVLSGGGTVTFTRSGAAIRGRLSMGTMQVPLLLVDRAATRGRAGRASGGSGNSSGSGGNGTASTTGSTSASSGSSAALSSPTEATVSSPDASSSLVVSGLGEFANIGGLTAFGSGAQNPFGNLNNITTTTPTSSTSIGVPGTGSTGVLSGGTLPSSGNTSGSGSGFTTGVGASPPVGTTT
ncbi:MAG TPA: hypothetical protein VN541_21485, partial [Tepidisphaeraceae bacterium]|nr:hypothetical protein [Tepidisphaeraceae bacterium]